MSAWNDAVGAVVWGPGPVTPEVVPAPPMDEWMEQHMKVLRLLGYMIAWKADVPVSEPDLNAEPFATWEANWQPESLLDMAAAGHAALYP